MKVFLKPYIKVSEEEILRLEFLNNFVMNLVFSNICKFYLSCS